MNQQEFDADLIDPEAWQFGQDFRDNPMRRLFDNPKQKNHKQHLPHNADITNPKEEKK
jgi:hypothetical protein